MGPIEANELQLSSAVEEDLEGVTLRPVDLAPEGGILGSTSRAWSSLTG